MAQHKKMLNHLASRRNLDFRQRVHGMRLIKIHVENSSRMTGITNASLTYKIMICIRSTRTSQMKILSIFFKYYLFCRSGTKLYHFST